MRKHLGLVLLSPLPLLLATLLTWGDVTYPWSMPVFVSGGLASIGLAWAAARAAPPSHTIWSWLEVFALWYLSMALLLRLLPDQKESARWISCLSNVKQLGRGMLMYAEDNDQRLPPADGWNTATGSPIQGELHCFAATSPWSYAMNSEASGSRVEADDPDDPGLRGPSDLVLVFEADARLPNASGGPEWLVLRHEGRTNICFADGHARSLKKDEVPSLRWNPSSEVTRSAP